jgi:hypothetical protein
VYEPSIRVVLLYEHLEGGHEVLLLGVPWALGGLTVLPPDLNRHDLVLGVVGEDDDVVDEVHGGVVVQDDLVLELGH